MTTTPALASGLRSPVASAVLVERLAPVVAEAQDVALQVCEHPGLRALYPELLRLLHGVVRASVPLLQAAEHEAVRRSAEGDAVASQLVPYVQAHAVEQLHHDVWLLDDYAALGLDAHEILDRPPSPMVAAMVGTTYYWIRHWHPVGVLGHLVATEGWPPTLERVDELRRRTGYPAEAFAALRHHAGVDADHGGELWDVLDRLPLTVVQLQVIGDAADQALTFEAAALRDLLGTQPVGAR